MRELASGLSDDVRDGLEGLEPHVMAMQAAARRVIQAGEGALPDVAKGREGLAVILDNEAEYLRRMDRVVDLYESEARGRVENLRRISWAVTGLTLAILAAIGLFIVRPAVELIRRQVAELALARDELEDPGPGADPRAGDRHGPAPDARRTVQPRRPDHDDRRDGVGLAHELNQPLGAIANYAEGCLVALERRAAGGR